MHMLHTYMEQHAYYVCIHVSVPLRITDIYLILNLTMDTWNYLHLYHRSDTLKYVRQCIYLLRTSVASFTRFNHRKQCKNY